MRGSLTISNVKIKPMMHKGWAVLSVLLIVGGLGMLLYPIVSGYLAECRQEDVICTYQTNLDELSKQELKRARAEAEAYNRQLCSAVRLSDQMVEEISGFSYEQLLNENEDGIMSYIEIPKIKVYLPVYHGTSETVLAKGAGHMQNTSLPVGGASTHCVISAHCGDPLAILFSDLDQMKEEDIFYMHTLGEILFYRVDQIKVVLPSEVEEFRVVEGEDHVTLVTCTPFGINSHRLLVRGKRVEETEAMRTHAADRDRRFAIGQGYWKGALYAVENTKRTVNTLLLITP